MIAVRICPNAKRNHAVHSLKRRRKEGNVEWLRRALEADPLEEAAVLLLGGARLAEFMARVAQRYTRIDMLPSFWSDAAIVVPDATDSQVGAAIYSAGLLGGLAGAHSMPRRNTIGRVDLTQIDDPHLVPNLALLRFHGAEATRTTEAIRLLEHGRLVVDLVSPLSSWLAFAWGAKGQSNPLLSGVPLPSALFAESVMSQLHIDILPGLDERTSCPEAIWQAALWWSEYYDDQPTGGQPPSGAYVVGQAAAAVTDEG